MVLQYIYLSDQNLLLYSTQKCCAKILHKSRRVNNVYSSDIWYACKKWYYEQHLSPHEKIGGNILISYSISRSCGAIVPRDTLL
jgi:hypothetical protein